MKNRRVFKAVLALFTLATLAIVTASANSRRVEKSPGIKPVSSQEAVSACKNKSSGVLVTFTDLQGQSIAATCTFVGGKLVAVPERNVNS